MQLRSIVSLACAVSLFTGSALASAVYTRRVDELTMERDIYASQKENWMNKAVERKETIEQIPMRAGCSLSVLSSGSIF